MLNKMLQKAQTVAIGGHERPDGDCIGSCMGMYKVLFGFYRVSLLTLAIRN